LELGQNYPNPFNSTTIISLTGDPESYPEIEIYDILGRLVKRLEVADEGGRYIWKGLDASGDRVSSGIYFYRVSGGQKIRSMTLLR
jgi:flagellar hook assembly protein FlgD